MVGHRTGLQAMEHLNWRQEKGPMVQDQRQWLELRVRVIFGGGCPECGVGIREQWCEDSVTIQSKENKKFSSSVIVVRFQGLDSHTWLMATILSRHRTLLDSQCWSRIPSLRVRSLS